VPAAGARRDLALLSAGAIVSTAGDAAALTALLLRLRPAGAGWVAVLLAAELVPFVLFAPVVGRVVDRFETHRVLLLTLVGQALVAVPLALVGSPAATVALFAALNALTALVRPATSALIPAITGPDGAARGYSLIATGVGVGWIVGPAAGGVLTAAIGSRGALLVDAVSFAVLAGAVLGVRARRVRTSAAPDAPNPGSGLRLLTGDPVLRVALLVSALATGCAVVDNVAAPFRFVDQLGTGSAGYGGYLALWGVGSLLGAQVLPLVGAARDEAALAAGNALTGLGIAVIGLAPSVAVAFVASVVGGFGNGLVNVAQSALINRRVPGDRIGRAFAALGAVTWSAIGVGTAVGAPLVDLLGAGRAMADAGALAVVPALAALALALRRGRRPATQADQEPA
jgi:MFS family permease